MADQSFYNMDYGALAQAGAQILGASMNAAVAAQTSERDRKFNTRVRAENRKWALEDYARMLEDSSPKAQVARLKAGGLNPNLVYGSGNVQTGVVSQPREATMPDSHVRPFQMDLAALNVLGNVLGAQLQKAEIKKTEAEAKKLESDATKSAAETEAVQIQNEINTATKDLQIAQASANYQQTLRLTAQIDNDIMNKTLLANSTVSLNDEQKQTLAQARLYQAKEYELREWEVGKNYEINLRRVAADESNAAANVKNAAANMLKAINDGKMTDAMVGHLVLQNEWDKAYREGYSAKDKGTADYWKDKLENKGLGMKYDYPDAFNKFRQGLRDIGSLIPFTNFGN